MILLCTLISQVAGVSKTGKEFEVEVVVTSFVIEEDIFYTGIITEVKGLTRHLSVSSISSDVEIREKQQKVGLIVYLEQSLMTIPFI